jgi:phage-related protein
MRLASGFKAQLGPSIASAGPIVTRIGQFITGTLVPAGRTLYAWFVDKIAPGIRGYVTPILAGLRSAFDSVKAAVERNRPQLEKIGNVLKTLAEFIAQKVAPVVGKILGEAFKLVGKALGGFIDGIGDAVDGISSFVGWVKDAVEWVERLAGKLKGGVGKALEKLPGFGLLSMGVTVTPTPSSAPAGFAGLTGGAAPLASSSSSSSSSLPEFLAVAPTYTETHVHLHVDGAFVGDEVTLARSLRRVFNAEADRFGWARA